MCIFQWSSDIFESDQSSHTHLKVNSQYSLTELGENSGFLGSELEQVKRKILLLRNISDVQHLRLKSTKYIKKFY